VKEVARDLWQLAGFPPNAINVYLADDVLVDAGTRQARRRILRQIRPHRVTAHVLTHAHPDHQGSSRAVCTALAIPLWCGDADADAVEDRRLMEERLGTGSATYLQRRLFLGPPHPVARRLREGDEVASFTVLDTPGHTRGHVALWRASDRTLIAGDVFFNLNMLTGRPQLGPPPNAFTEDPARNRQSMRRLAALEPAVVVFGHGPPLRNPVKLRAIVDSLAA
jgi:hydroxyacylglutathione hydrolase